jgi:hypothetical protein
MAPSTPPPPNRDVLAALTMASTSRAVISPFTMRIAGIRAPVAVQALGPALKKQPVRQFRFSEGQSICVVVIGARILGVNRAAPRSPPCRYAITCRAHRHDFVGVSMEIPQWRGNRRGAFIEGFAAARDHGSREKTGPIGQHVPDPCPTHRVPGHIDAPLVNRVLSAQIVDNLQGQSIPFTEAGKLFRRILRADSSDERNTF